MTDGYTGYQHLLTRLRRHPAVLSAHNQAMPGGRQARPRRPAVLGGEIIAILREAHQAVQDARARGSTALGADLLDKLRQRYDEAAAFGIVTTGCGTGRTGTTPATRSAAGCAATKSRSSCSPAISPGLDDQRRGPGGESSQAPPGRPRLLASLAALARWCRIRSYLHSTTGLGITALDAVRHALAGEPWLPQLPAVS